MFFLLPLHLDGMVRDQVAIQMLWPPFWETWLPSISIYSIYCLNYCFKKVVKKEADAFKF